MLEKIIKVLSVVAVIFIVVFAQHYPNLYASWLTPDGYSYNYQASWFDPWDINVYVTAIRYGQEGNILLKNHYNSIPQSKPSFIYPLYTISGKLSSANPYLIFHALAVTASIIVTATIFFWYKRIFLNFIFAISATLVCLLGGGMGALLGKTDVSAASQITSFSFQSAAQRAHEGIGLILYLAALMTTYYYYQEKKTNKAAVIIISSLLIGVVFYPYYILSYLLISFLFLYLQTRSLSIRTYSLLVLIAGIVGGVTFLYYLHLQSSTFSAAASENLPNVSIPSLLIGYGGFFLFFSIHAFIEKKQISTSHQKIRLFFMIWFIVSIVLSYLPWVGFSRFYLRGLFFPLTGLMFLYLYYTKSQILQYFLTLCFLVVLLFSRFNIFMLRIESVKDKNPWVYSENEMVEALDFLKNSPKDGVISLDYAVCNLIPAFTGKRVYFGHMLQTPNARERINSIIDFYSGKFSDEEALAFLRSNKISYIIYSPKPHSNKVPSYQFMENVFKNEKVQIYTVDQRTIN